MDRGLRGEDAREGGDVKPVVLLPYELEMAAYVGVRRNLEAMASGRVANWGDSSDCWRPHILGAMAELAFAKWANVYWEGSVNTFRGRPDVAGCEVRWARDDELKIYPREAADKANTKFVLVRGVGPTFDVLGWAYGRDALAFPARRKHPQGPEAHFIPSGNLNSFDDWQ